MSRARHELEPSVAAGRALAALLQAGRYSGDGMTTVGKRVSRRAVVVGAEGARRTGDAWSALHGAPAPRRRMDGFVGGVAAGSAAGFLSALVVWRGVVAWRRTDPATAFGRRLRDVWRKPADPAAAISDPPVDTSIVAEPESLATAQPRTVG
jgi:hypothetical protein